MMSEVGVVGCEGYGGRNRWNFGCDEGVLSGVRVGENIDLDGIGVGDWCNGME